MKWNRLLSVCTCVGMLTTGLCFSADAANYQLKTEQGMIVIQGEGEPSQSVMLRVEKKDGGTTLSNTYYMDEIMSTEDGSSTFSFYMRPLTTGENLTGDYIAYIRTNGTVTTELPFSYVDYALTLSALESAAAVSEMKAIFLEANGHYPALAVLGVNLTDYALLDDGEKTALFEGLLLSMPDTFTIEAFNQEFNRGIGVILTNKTEETDVRQGLSLLNFSYEGTDFVSSQEENLKTYLVQQFAKQSQAMTYSQMASKYTELNLMYRAKTATYGQLRALIEANQGLLLQNATQSYPVEEQKKNALALKLTELLCTSSVDSYAAFGEVFDTAVTAISTQGSGITSGGGVSSGGGGGGGMGGFSVANTSKDEQEEILPESTVSNHISFSDVSAAYWAKDAIEYLAGKKVIQGYKDGSFQPENLVTRSELVKMIVVSLGIAEDDVLFPFADVTTENWAYPYVKRAYAAGITKGVNETTFRPDAYVTRQDMAVMVSRGMHIQNIFFEEVREYPGFFDGETISDYAQEDIEKLYRAGLINGYETNNFDAYGNATRAEVAELMYRIVNQYNLQEGL